MSEPKRPSYNALLRKIARLEDELAEVRQSQAKSFDAMREYLHESVDLRMRAQQAIAILNGEDA